MATIFRPPVVTRIPSRDSSAAILAQSGVTGINILVHTNPVPFHQTDWPVPAGPTARCIELRNETQPLQIQLLPLPPIRQFDWPVPKGPQYPISLRTHTASKFPPPAAAVQPPFFQTDWPVPKGPEWNRDLRSHSESLDLAQIYGVKPFGSIDQIFVPSAPRFNPGLLLQPPNLLTTTLATAPVGSPFVSQLGGAFAQFQARLRGLNSGLEFQPPNLLTTTLSPVVPTSGLYDIWHYYSP